MYYFFNLQLDYIQHNVKSQHVCWKIQCGNMWPYCIVCICLHYNDNDDNRHHHDHPLEVDLAWMGRLFLSPPTSWKRCSRRTMHCLVVHCVLSTVLQNVLFSFVELQWLALRFTECSADDFLTCHLHGFAFQRPPPKEYLRQLSWLLIHNNQKKKYEWTFYSGFCLWGAVERPYQPQPFCLLHDLLLFRSKTDWLTLCNTICSKIQRKTPRWPQGLPKVTLGPARSLGNPDGGATRWSSRPLCNSVKYRRFKVKSCSGRLSWPGALIPCLPRSSTTNPPNSAHAAQCSSSYCRLVTQIMKTLKQMCLHR